MTKLLAVKVGDQVTCWNCNGTGSEAQIDFAKSRKYAIVCTECDGTRVVTVEENHDEDDE